MLFNVALASGAGVLFTLPPAMGTPLPRRTPGSLAGGRLVLFTSAGRRHRETRAPQRRRRELLRKGNDYGIFIPTCPRQA